MARETSSKRQLDRLGDKILFENERVRVWSVVPAPGQHEPWHQHLLPYLIVPLTEGKNRMTFDDGRVRDTGEAGASDLAREPAASGAGTSNRRH